MLDDEILRGHFRQFTDSDSGPAFDMAKTLSVARQKQNSRMKGVLLIAGIVAAAFLPVSIATGHSPFFGHEIADAVRRYNATHHTARPLEILQPVSLAQAEQDANFHLQPPTGTPRTSRLIELDESHADGTITFSFTYVIARTKQHFSVSISQKTERAMHLYSRIASGLPVRWLPQSKRLPRWASIRMFVWTSADEIVTVPQNTLTNAEIARMRSSMHGKALYSYTACLQTIRHTIQATRRWFSSSL